MTRLEDATLEELVEMLNEALTALVKARPVLRPYVAAVIAQWDGGSVPDATAFDAAVEALRVAERTL